jgi:hypothetical protein
MAFGRRHDGEGVFIACVQAQAVTHAGVARGERDMQPQRRADRHGSADKASTRRPAQLQVREDQAGHRGRAQQQRQQQRRVVVVVQRPQQHRGYEDREEQAEPRGQHIDAPSIERDRQRFRSTRPRQPGEAMGQG